MKLLIINDNVVRKFEKKNFRGTKHAGIFENKS